MIPAYNDLAAVIACAKSLHKAAFDKANLHIYIQDDASPAVDMTILNGFEGWSVERNPANLGFPGNCNAGARRGTSDIIVFCNQDVLAHPQLSEGWDSPLRLTFNTFSLCAIIGARLLFPNLSIQSAGGFFDADCQPYHRCLGYENPFTEEVSGVMPVPWVTGAFYAVRRSVWEALGGFDPVYIGGYFEDVDFCLKAAESGYQTWYQPFTTLFHQVGSTGGNPHFMHNAQIFRQRWVDTGKVKPDVSTRRVNFWNTPVRMRPPGVGTS